MNPKEKAFDLFKKMRHNKWVSKEGAIECALTCVDEIDKALDFDWMEVQSLDREHEYWSQVKQEIEKL